MKPTCAPFLIASLLAACDLPELREGQIDAAAGGAADASDPPPSEADASDPPPGTADAAVDATDDGDETIPPGSTIGSCDPRAWTALASASHPANPPEFAIDGLVPSRWTSGSPQSPGLTFDIDFGGFVLVDRVTIEHAFATDGLGDFPRGFTVLASYDGVEFTRTLANPFFTESTGTVSAEFPARAARTLRLQLNQGGGGAWWTIHDLRLGCATPDGGGVDAGTGGPDAGPDDMLPTTGVDPNRAAWTATASGSSPTDPPAGAIDGSGSTRWASGKAPQYGDEWLRIDLGRPVAVTELWLTSVPNDYPSAYAIDLSTDDLAFTTVARGLGADITRIGLPGQSARYLRIRQIGSGHDHWWGINDVTIVE